MSKPSAWYTNRIMGDTVGGTLTSGEQVYVEVNQGTREGHVLAVLEDEALIEYTMPNGTSAMWIVKREFPYGRVRNQSYYSVPIKWLRAIVEDGMDWWEGVPQQQNQIKGPVLTPWEHLEERTG